ncbi:MAG: PAS domain-containing protein [Spirochaetales bacterium]|nr:PAS domain-containing protein [Spirochaetales bacterium]
MFSPALGPLEVEPPAPVPVDRPTVLALHSYALDFAWTRSVDDGIEAALDGKATLVREFLDAKRSTAPEDLDRAERAIAARHDRDAFDLVILSDNVAFDFFAERGARIFPDTPVVFCGINDWGPELAERLPGSCGVVENVDYAGTAALARELFPSLRRLVLFADATSGGRGTLADARRQIAAAQPDLELVSGSGAGLFEAAGAARPPEGAEGESAILLLSYVTDGEGVVWPAGDIANILDRESGLPVFTSHDAFFAPPALGGAMVSGFDQGRRAGEMAAALLEGSGSWRVETEGTPPVRLVDWYVYQSRRLGTRPPEGYAFHGEPVSFARREPGATWFAVCALIVAVSAILLLYRLWNRALDARFQAVESAASFRAMFDNLPMGAAMHRLVRDAGGKPTDYRIVQVNPAFGPVLGKLGSSAEGRLASEVYGGAVLLDRYARIAASRTHESFELEFGRQTLRVSSYGTGDDGFVTMFEDISERKEAERRLAAAEERYRLAVEATEDVIWDWHLPSGRFSFSPRWYEITGYSESELPPSYDSWVAIVHPDDAAKAIGYARRKAPDGRRYVHEYRILTRDRRELWIEERGRVVESDPSGRPKRVIGSFTDVSARHRMLEEMNRSAGDLARKNEELERFAYTISHDLKSPLITIKGFLAFLEKDYAEGNAERFAKDLGRIGGAADRMQELLTDILEFSRAGRDANPPKRFQARPAIEEALENLAEGIRRREAKVELDVAQLELEGDRPRFVELFQNLVENALKYGGERRDLAIAVRGFPFNARARFRVEDNGIGMEPEYLENVFGLFNKLDPKSEGTGLGLALARRIVEHQGGSIRAESEGLGKGSAFVVELPLAPSAP